MMNIIRRVCVPMLMLVTMANAATPESLKSQVTAATKKMYSYSANMFEAGEFDRKYSAEKHCFLLREFFVEDLLRLGKSSGQRCDLGVFIRYPGLGSDEFDMYGELGAISKPKLSLPEVDDGKASIAVKTEFGSVIFFLIQTDKGWRIENALYDEWPLIKDGKCRSDFLVVPSAWQKKKAPPICQ